MSISTELGVMGNIPLSFITSPETEIQEQNNIPNRYAKNFYQAFAFIDNVNMNNVVKASASKAHLIKRYEKKTGTSALHVLHLDNIKAIKENECMKKIPFNQFLKRNYGDYVRNNCIKCVELNGINIAEVTDKISSFLIANFYDIICLLAKKDALTNARLATIFFLCDLNFDCDMYFHDPYGIINKCVELVFKLLKCGSKLPKIKAALATNEKGFRLQEVFCESELLEMRTTFRPERNYWNYRMESDTKVPVKDENWDIAEDLSTLGEMSFGDSDIFSKMTDNFGNDVNWEKFGLSKELYESDDSDSWYLNAFKSVGFFSPSIEHADRNEIFDDDYDFLDDMEVVNLKRPVNPGTASRKASQSHTVQIEAKIWRYRPESPDTIDSDSEIEEVVLTEDEEDSLQFEIIGEATQVYTDTTTENDSAIQEVMEIEIEKEDSLQYEIDTESTQQNASQTVENDFETVMETKSEAKVTIRKPSQTLFEVHKIVENAVFEKPESPQYEIYAETIQQNESQIIENDFEIVMESKSVAETTQQNSAEIFEKDVEAQKVMETEVERVNSLQYEIEAETLQNNAPQTLQNCFEAPKGLRNEAEQEDSFHYEVEAKITQYNVPKTKENDFEMQEVIEIEDDKEVSLQCGIDAEIIQQDVLQTLENDFEAQEKIEIATEKANLLQNKIDFNAPQIVENNFQTQAGKESEAETVESLQFEIEGEKSQCNDPTTAENYFEPLEVTESETTKEHSLQNGTDAKITQQNAPQTIENDFEAQKMMENKTAKADLLENQINTETTDYTQTIENHFDTQTVMENEVDAEITQHNVPQTILKTQKMMENAQTAEEDFQTKKIKGNEAEQKNSLQYETIQYNAPKTIENYFEAQEMLEIQTVKADPLENKIDTETIDYNAPETIENECQSQTVIENEVEAEVGERNISQTLFETQKMMDNEAFEKSESLQYNINAEVAQHNAPQKLENYVETQKVMETEAEQEDSLQYEMEAETTQNNVPETLENSVGTQRVMEKVDSPQDEIDDETTLYSIQPTIQKLKAEKEDSLHYDIRAETTQHNVLKSTGNLFETQEVTKSETQKEDSIQYEFDTEISGNNAIGDFNNNEENTDSLLNKLDEIINGKQEINPPLNEKQAKSVKISISLADNKTCAENLDSNQRKETSKLATSEENDASLSSPPQSINDNTTTRGDIPYEEDTTIPVPQNKKRALLRIYRSRSTENLRGANHLGESHKGKSHEKTSDKPVDGERTRRVSLGAAFAPSKFDNDGSESDADSTEDNFPRKKNNIIPVPMLEYQSSVTTTNLQEENNSQEKSTNNIFSQIIENSSIVREEADVLETPQGIVQNELTAMFNDDTQFPSSPKPSDTQPFLKTLSSSVTTPNFHNALQWKPPHENMQFQLPSQNQIQEENRTENVVETTIVPFRVSNEQENQPSTSGVRSQLRGSAMEELKMKGTNAKDNFSILVDVAVAARQDYDNEMALMHRSVSESVENQRDSHESVPLNDDSSSSDVPLVKFPNVDDRRDPRRQNGNGRRSRSRDKLDKGRKKGVRSSSDPSTSAFSRIKRGIKSAVENMNRIPTKKSVDSRSKNHKKSHKKDVDETYSKKIVDSNTCSLEKDDARVRRKMTLRNRGYSSINYRESPSHESFDDAELVVRETVNAELVVRETINENCGCGDNPNAESDPAPAGRHEDEMDRRNQSPQSHENQPRQEPDTNLNLNSVNSDVPTNQPSVPQQRKTIKILQNIIIKPGNSSNGLKKSNTVTISHSNEELRTSQNINEIASNNEEVERDLNQTETKENSEEKVVGSKNEDKPATYENRIKFPKNGIKVSIELAKIKRLNLQVPKLKKTEENNWIVQNASGNRIIIRKTDCVNATAESITKVDNQTSSFDVVEDKLSEKEKTDCPEKIVVNNDNNGKECGCHNVNCVIRKKTVTFNILGNSSSVNRIKASTNANESRPVIKNYKSVLLENADSTVGSEKQTKNRNETVTSQQDDVNRDNETKLKTGKKKRCKVRFLVTRKDAEKIGKNKGKSKKQKKPELNDDKNSLSKKEKFGTKKGKQSFNANASQSEESKIKEKRVKKKHNKKSNGKSPNDDAQDEVSEGVSTLEEQKKFFDKIGLIQVTTTKKSTNSDSEKSKDTSIENVETEKHQENIQQENTAKSVPLPQTNTLQTPKPIPIVTKQEKTVTTPNSMKPKAKKKTPKNKKQTNKTECKTHTKKSSSKRKKHKSSSVTNEEKDIPDSTNPVIYNCDMSSPVEVKFNVVKEDTPKKVVPIPDSEDLKPPPYRLKLVCVTTPPDDAETVVPPTTEAEGNTDSTPNKANSKSKTTSRSTASKVLNNIVERLAQNLAKKSKSLETKTVPVAPLVNTSNDNTKNPVESNEERPASVIIANDLRLRANTPPPPNEEANSNQREPRNDQPKENEETPQLFRPYESDPEPNPSKKLIQQPIIVEKPVEYARTIQCFPDTPIMNRKIQESGTTHNYHNETNLRETNNTTNPTNVERSGYIERVPCAPSTSGTKRNTQEPSEQRPKRVRTTPPPPYSQSCDPRFLATYTQPPPPPPVPPQVQPQPHQQPPFYYSGSLPRRHVCRCYSCPFTRIGGGTYFRHYLDQCNCRFCIHRVINEREQRMGTIARQSSSSNLESMTESRQVQDRSESSRPNSTNPSDDILGRFMDRFPQNWRLPHDSSKE